MKRIVVIVLGLFIISCGGKQEKSSTLESRNFDAERETFFSGLHHSPDEITMILIPGLAGFDSTLLNDASSFSQYIGNDVKAASNLGIYLSDLNYCVLYKQSTSTKKYFDAVYELSRTIGIEKTTLDFLAKRYADNIARNDSVKLVMNQLFDKSTSGLRGTDRERLAGIAMAAYQIENLHLVLSALESLPENLTEEQLQSQKLLLQYVLNQQGKFEITHNFLKTFSDPLDPNKNPNYPFFDNALRELIGSYSQLVQSNQEGQAKILQMKNNPVLSTLKEKTNNLRTKIISND
jgi:hypothetical protein